MDSLDARLSERARRAGLTLDDRLRTSLLSYYQLLTRWNAKVNLTSLVDPDEAIDRLLLEPVAAAPHLPPADRLIDLGSGGGSPAIPLALVLHSPQIVMVESRGRKAAFLREAARTVHLKAIVEEQRFEVLADSNAYRAGFDVVSMRAVRMDEEALGAASRFLAPGGALALFVTPGTQVILLPNHEVKARVPLLSKAELVLMSATVPRGT